MSADIIVVKDLHKIYKAKKDSINKDPVLSLRSVSFSVKRGSFFGLIGLNGAGKSTIINIIAGTVIKTSGSIVINNFDIDKDYIQFRRSLGIVPQDIIFDPFFTVGGILNYYAGFFGVPAKERRVKEVAAMLDIEDKLDVNPRKLSGGMKRRLLIAKAMIHNPPVMFLDEPTASLDIESRSKMWQCLQQVNKSGVTIILTTHYMEEVEKFCDDIALIHRGDILLHSTKEDILEKFGSRSLMLSLTKPLSATQTERLVSSSGEAILVNDNKLQLFSPGSREADFPITKVIKELDSMGIGVCDVHSKEPKFEDIILRLVESSEALAKSQN